MTYKYSRILVSGGAGFIGSHLVDALINKGFDVTVLDNLDTGRLENIAPHNDNDRFHFVKGDVRDVALVKNTMNDIDVVFHEAAQTSVPRSVKDPLLTNDVNVKESLSLLNAAAARYVQRFIFASSTAIYGDTPSKN